MRVRNPGLPTSVNEVLRAARLRVEAGEAEWLLLHALGRGDRAWLYGHGDDVLDADALARFDALLSRREAGEPIAYLLGRRGFWTLELQATPAVLIPRPETELLVEAALARLPADRATCVADLGTGSGAVALSLAAERPRAHVVAIDASDDALAVASANAQRHGIGNVAFRRSDWWSALAGERFDAIVSNPPYLADDDPHLGQGDLRYEPRMALASGADGLDAIRLIAGGAAAHLHAGGWLLLEHGYAQGAAVRDLLARAGFADVATLRDLEDRERVTLGRTH